MQDGNREERNEKNQHFNTLKSYVASIHLVSKCDTNIMTFTGLESLHRILCRKAG